MQNPILIVFCVVFFILTKYCVVFSFNQFPEKFYFCTIKQNLNGICMKDNITTYSNSNAFEFYKFLEDVVVY